MMQVMYAAIIVVIVLVVCSQCSHMRARRKRRRVRKEHRDMAGNPRKVRQGHGYETHAPNQAYNPGGRGVPPRYNAKGLEMTAQEKKMWAQQQNDAKIAKMTPEQRDRFLTPAQKQRWAQQQKLQARQNEVRSKQAALHARQHPDKAHSGYPPGQAIVQHPEHFHEDKPPTYHQQHSPARLNIQEASPYDLAQDLPHHGHPQAAAPHHGGGAAAAHGTGHPQQQHHRGAPNGSHPQQQHARQAAPHHGGAQGGDYPQQVQQVQHRHGATSPHGALKRVTET
jgi:hypothetical protein